MEKCWLRLLAARLSGNDGVNLLAPETGGYFSNGEVMFKPYKTTEVVRVSSADIGLNEDQARRRARKIEKAKSKAKMPEGVRVYRMMDLVTFKAGEVIYLKDVPKHLYSSLETEDGEGLTAKYLKEKRAAIEEKQAEGAKEV